MPSEAYTTPWWTIHRNLAYPGELVLAERWQRELGHLPADCSFRIVLLKDPQEVPKGELVERSLAVWVPGTSLLPTAGKASSPRTVREGPSAYRAGAAIEEPLQALRSSWKEYAQGEIRTAASSFRPPGVKGAQEAERALELIGGQLLEKSYPRLPLAVERFPRPFTQETAELVFRSLLGQQYDALSLQACREFAPLLGLAAPGSPEVLAPQDCPAIALLEERLRQGIVTAPELYRELVHGWGLPAPLVTLYLLAFIVARRGDVELYLRPGEKKVLSDGTILIQRLSAAAVAKLPGAEALKRDFFGVGPPLGRLWAQALPYLRQLFPDHPWRDTPEDPSALLEKLTGLRHSLQECQAGLRQLAALLSEDPEPEVLQVLSRWEALARSAETAQCCGQLLVLFPSPQTVTEEKELLERLRLLCSFQGEIAVLYAYLQGATVPEEEQELALDRLAILEQLSLRDLLAHPHLWPSVKALFEWFRSRYQPRYLEFHRQHHQERTQLQSRLERVRAQLKALDLLNTLSELGEPVGAEFSQEYAVLRERTAPCAQVQAGALTLDRHPQCPACQIPMTLRNPSAEVERFLAALEAALATQCRRLSTEAIRQILERGKGGDRLDQFLRILRAADTAALAKLLDEEMIQFLRSLLAEGQTYLLVWPALRELRQRFGVIGEEEVELVVQELRHRLREGFAAAKAEQPHKRIRLRLR